MSLSHNVCYNRWIARHEQEGGWGSWLVFTFAQMLVSRHSMGTVLWDVGRKGTDNRPAKTD